MYSTPRSAPFAVTPRGVIGQWYYKTLIIIFVSRFLFIYRTYFINFSTRCWNYRCSKLSPTPRGPRPRQDVHVNNSWRTRAAAMTQLWPLTQHAAKTVAAVFTDDPTQGVPAVNQHKTFHIYSTLNPEVYFSHVSMTTLNFFVIDTASRWKLKRMTVEV
jgi:hypothetical protein